MASSVSRVLFLVLLVGGATTAFAAHSKARAIELLDADFQMGDSGTIEASLNPPIQGALRIIVQTKVSSSRSMTLDVTQWDRTIPYRVVNQSGRHRLFGSRPAQFVAEIDVNDLTPGVPVHIRVHSNLSSSPHSDPPDLEARAYAVVY